MRHAARVVVGLAFATGILSYSRDARAAEDEPRQLVQELFLGETVFPQEKGELQVTVAPILRRSELADSLASGLKLEYGLSSRLQVEVEAEPYVLRSGSGERSSTVGELELGLRWSALDVAGSGLHLSLGGGIGLRSEAEAVPGEDGNDNGREWTAGLVVGRDLGPLHLVAGLAAEGSAEIGEERGDALRVHAAFVAPIGGRLRASAELLWRSLGRARETWLAPGLTARLGRRFELGMAVGFGLSDDSDSLRADLRATWEFGGADAD